MNDEDEGLSDCEPDFFTSIVPRIDGKYDALLLIHEEIVARATFESVVEAEIYLLLQAQSYFRKLAQY